MSDRQIHINRAGQACGPFPEESARKMLAAGQLLATDLAWYDGAAEWKPLGEVLGTAKASPAAAPPPAPPATSGDGGLKRQVAGSKPKEEEKKEEKKKEGEEKDDPDKIYVTRKGEAIGPYPRDKAKGYFIAGTLLPTDWGWHDGMGEDWKPLNEVLELPAPAGAGGAPAGGSAAGGGSWTIGGCFSEGWQAFKGNLGGAILFYFIASIVLFITAIIPLVNPFVLVPVLAGYMYYFIKLARREPAAIGDLFAGFKRGYGQLLLVCLLIGVIWMIANLPGVSVMIFSGAAFIADLTGTIQDAMAGKIDDWEAVGEGIVTSFKAAGVGLLVGMILMMLLPLIALSFTVFSMPLVIDRQMKAIDAILASARLMKGQWFKTVFFLIVVSIVSSIGQLAFGIGVLFTAPIGMAAWASFYLKNASAITAAHTAPVAKGMKIGLVCACILPVGAAVTAVVMAGGSIMRVAEAVDANGTAAGSQAGDLEKDLEGTYMWLWSGVVFFTEIYDGTVASMTLDKGGVGKISDMGGSPNQPIKWRVDPEKKDEILISMDEKVIASARVIPNKGLKLLTFVEKVGQEAVPLKDNQQILAIKKDILVGRYLLSGPVAGRKGQLVLKKNGTATWIVNSNTLQGEWDVQHMPQSASLSGEVLLSVSGAGMYCLSIQLDKKPIGLQLVARQFTNPEAETGYNRIPNTPQEQLAYTKTKGGGQGGRPGMQQGGRPGGGQQGIRPGGGPGGQQGIRPGGQQGIRPGGQQGIRPSMQQGIRPGGGQQGIRPGGQQGIQPGVQQGGRPGGGKGVRPGVRPGGVQPTPPQK